MDEAGAFGVAGPLLWRRKNKQGMNRRRGFAEFVSALNVDELVAEYEHDQRVAPRRSERSKKYFVAGHDGIPGSGESTKRFEEHLALALFGHCDAGGRFVRPSGDHLRVIDYQVPLKANQTDQTGKIDLLGLLSDGRVCVIELKSPKGFGDSPLHALIEGLSYAAVLEASREAFEEELLAQHPDAVRGAPFVLIVLGPASWWQAWENAKKTGAWKQPFNDLCATLQARLGVTIACAALDGFDRSTLVLGLNRQAPSLGSIPVLIDVAGLPAIPAPVTRLSDANSYLSTLLATMHTYAETAFDPSMFDGHSESTRPPVFRTEHAHRNIIAAPEDQVTDAIVRALPASARHQHFASMRSSQALTQSVFGALAATGRIDVLESVEAECGRPAFAKDLHEHTMRLEKNVTWLAEPRPTSVDVWFETTNQRIAVECKLTEPEFGPCSRPKLARDHPSYCDGSYSQQMQRQQRCALSELGIAYWQHIPQLFEWAADRDHSPCPFDATYQIVRNVLAAVVTPDRGVDIDTGHALIVYDARSPAFAFGGAARNALDVTYGALRYPQALRTVSWQTLIASISVEPEFAWLVEALAEKFGLTGEPRAPYNRAIDTGETSQSPSWSASISTHVGGLSFVYGRAIDLDGYVLLSVRGNSYRLRNPRRDNWAGGYLIDGIPTIDGLLNSGLIEDIRPVTDREGRVDSDQAGWKLRLAEINSERIAEASSDFKGTSNL